MVYDGKLSRAKAERLAMQGSRGEKYELEQNYARRNTEPEITDSDIPF